MFRIQISPSLVLALLDLPHATALFELTSKNREFLARWLPWVGFIQHITDTEKLHGEYVDQAIYSLIKS